MTSVASGQIYRRADDLEQRWVRIKIVQVIGDRVEVTDEDGRYPRWIQARNLHPDATTKTGRTRRTGYVLVGADEHAAE